MIDLMPWGGKRDGAGRPEKPAKERLVEQYPLRCTHAERAAWERAAKAADQQLSDWMREQLNKAAK
jgi:hypothetical protein